MRIGILYRQPRDDKGGADIINLSLARCRDACRCVELCSTFDCRFARSYTFGMATVTG